MNDELSEHRERTTEAFIQVWDVIGMMQDNRSRYDAIYLRLTIIVSVVTSTLVTFLLSYMRL
jgi:hypothetical protein